ncbi:MAG: phenylalanine--tRNA ligase subunit beta [Oceanococcus sp.]|nr:MAG: phenylalanine--tRNA ligase subunit beta [Oceanococcus sp.]
MKISYQWLSEWAETKLSAAQAGEVLTMAGLELDDLEPAAPALDGVVVAEILNAERHPDADRLQVCSVDAGQDQPLQIVCGAPNARPGIKVALATIGTRLPGDFNIKKSKIRGQESFGMLCSGGELGMDETDGIIELPQGLTVGSALSDALALDDSILDIALTPNRGDCFSVRGVARELACLTGVGMTRPFDASAPQVSLEDTPVIRIEDAADCRRYAGRVVRGLDRTAATPLWMAERLRRAGLRSINPLVDVTNYVLMELGQPMHAFDLSKLEGDICVRRARAGETLTLLNEQAIELDEQSLVIADKRAPVALAGAMGGLDSSVDEKTTDVLLESACFTPRAVAGTGRRFKLSSDSLQRFERGVDPSLQELALDRATNLLISICGGQAGPASIEEATAWTPPQIELSAQRVQALLGSPVAPEAMVDILRKLECTVTSDGALLKVTPPSHRYDLNEAIDLVEEIARIHGYDNLPGRERRVGVALSAPRADAASRIRRELVARGYHEAVSFSFADSGTDDALNGDSALAPVMLDNPMSAAMAQMRRSLWASLIPVWKHNAARQQERIRLFELGRKYGKRDDRIEEIECVAGLISGLAQPEQWASTKRNVDFYDLKADVTALLGDKAEALQWSDQNPHPALHPGRSASLLLDGECVGVLGEIHPRLKKTLDLPHSPLLFEIQRRVVDTLELPKLSPITATPSSRRDLALLVDQTLAAENLIQYVKKQAGDILREVRVFDVFTGDALPKGCKSVALGLIFQDFSRTLTDEDVDAAIQKLTSGLEREFGAQIRD